MSFSRSRDGRGRGARLGRAGLGGVGVAALALAVLAGVGEARCRSVMDCSRGACVSLQECDSALDPRADTPPGSPLPPRPITPERPGSSLSAPPRLVPPAGTSQCRPSYVCVAGRCAWETVCN